MKVDTSITQWFQPEVTKDLLDMIGEFRGLLHPLPERIDPSPKPPSQQCHKNTYVSSIGLVDLFGSQQAPCRGLHGADSLEESRPSSHFINVQLE